jgi:hypothetical protein
MSRIDEYDKDDKPFFFSEKEILLKIIENNGRCDWILEIKQVAGCSICNNCPLSKLAKDSQGKYKTCYSSIVGDNANFAYTQDADAVKYLKAAEELLMNKLLEEQLQEEKHDN